MLNLNRSNFQAHPFHLVSPSPWPLYTSISLLSLTTSAVLSFHGFAYAGNNLIMSLISLVLSMAFWWRDVIAEGTLNLKNTILFNYNLNITRAIPVEDLEKSLNDLSITTPQKVLSMFLLKLKFNVFFRLYGHISKYNPVRCKDIALLSLKEINSYNIIPLYQNSIFVSIFLSGGWLLRSRLNNSLACVKFRQPYLNKEYIYYVFNEISLYCRKDPYRFTSGSKWKGKPVDELLIATKWLHCFTGYDTLFYRNKAKIVPGNIYDLLTPLVLFHWIMGSSVKLKGRGILISICDFNIIDTVKLINVLIIKYSLHCNLLSSSDKKRIYIYRSSLEHLIRTIKPVFMSSANNMTEQKLYYISKLFYDILGCIASSNSEIKIPYYNKLNGGANNFNKLQRRTISTISLTEQGVPKSKLNSWFVTGFTDAEGCFGLYLANNSKNRSGWNVIIRFELHLHVKDYQLLEEIREFFGGIGSITHYGDSAHYIVRSISELEKILKHFDDYPLLSKKYADFVLFKSAIDIIKQGNLTLAEITRIVAIKASMNKGLSDKLKNSFPDIVPVQRLQPNNTLIPDRNWLVGFIEGEACFLINISKSAGKLGESVQLTFEITQHTQDLLLLQTIISFLGCGRIKKFSGKNLVNIIVSKFSEIDENILPLLDKHSLRGHKFLNYKDFKKAAELIKSKAHLTKEGLLEIKEIKAGMNRLRK